MSRKRWPWEAQGVVVAHKEAQARRGHRVNRWLTIFLPLIVVGALLAGVAVWAVAGAPAAVVGKAADAVVIGMTLVCMAAALPLLAARVALVVLTARAQQRLPEATLWVLQTLRTVRQTLVHLSERTASPFIRWQATRAAWRAGWQALRKGGRE